MTEIKLIGVKELSEMVGVPKSWIYARTRFGTDGIPHVRVGKYVKFVPEEIMEFIKKNGQLMTQSRK